MKTQTPPKIDPTFVNHLKEKFNLLVRNEKENRAELSTIYLTLKQDYMTKHEFKQWAKRYELPKHYEEL